MENKTNYDQFSAHLNNVLEKPGKEILYARRFSTAVTVRHAVDMMAYAGLSVGCDVKRLYGQAKDIIMAKGRVSEDKEIPEYYAETVVHHFCTILYAEGLAEKVEGKYSSILQMYARLCG